MRVAKPLLIGASALALAVGYAFADKPANDPGFNALDKNNDGYLSRTEYLTVMTKKDLHTAKEKVTGNKDQNAATGGTKPAK